MLTKSRRVDEEEVQLAKEYAKLLEKQRGGKFSQNRAIKIALKKVLLKDEA